MARPASEKHESWYPELAELMARTGMGVKEAAGELGLDITTETCELVAKRKGFNRLLWEHRHRYFNSLANSPDFSQNTLVGKLMVQAQKLEENESYDKAAEVLLKIAKIRGWVGPENQISIFGELSQSDIDKLRDTLSKNDTRPIKSTIQ